MATCQQCGKHESIYAVEFERGKHFELWCDICAHFGTVVCVQCGRRAGDTDTVHRTLCYRCIEYNQRL